MKAISLHQPWATAIKEEIKFCETRSWKPPARLIGERVAIHAAKRKPSVEFQALRDKGYGVSQSIPLGAVVATAKLENYCLVDRHEDGGVWASGLVPGRGRQRFRIDDYGDFSVGRYLWLLIDVEVVEPPVPARGYQGFWEWNENEQAA